MFHLSPDAHADLTFQEPDPPLQNGDLSLQRAFALISLTPTAPVRASLIKMLRVTSQSAHCFPKALITDRTWCAAAPAQLATAAAQGPPAVG